MQTSLIALAKLHSDPFNARRHSDRNLQAVTSSLQKFGQVEPLVVQAKTLRVIGGNGRLEAMKKLGWVDAACVVLPLTNEAAKALGVALNRTAELAEWDYSQLAALLQEVAQTTPLEDLGFSQPELDALLLSVAYTPGEQAPSIIEGEQKGERPADEAPAPTIQCTNEEMQAPARVLVTCVDASAAKKLARTLLGNDGVLSARKC